MKFIQVLIVVALMFGSVATSQALQGVLATVEDIARLKVDVLAGRIKVGITRLKEISRTYGEAATITDTNRRLTYEYRDLKIDFDKHKYMRKWEYDSFKQAAYSDEIDSLRSDLSKGQIVGDYVTLISIQKEYGPPTEYIETDRDGEMSYYYYGNIKLTFENFIVVKQWRGKNLTASGKLESGAGDTEDELLLSTGEESEGSTLK